jgi:hypothetical protein
MRSATMNKKSPNVLVFDDDELIRFCWDLAGRKGQKIETLYSFGCWEEFTSKANPELLEGAVAFVDFQFDKVRSQYDGIDNAKNLREMGVERIYPITGNPQFVVESSHLFSGILGKEVPRDIRALAA